MSATSTAQRFFAIVATLAVAAMMGGCAHPIALNPDLGKLASPTGAVKIAASVGLSISDEERGRQVTTAGGGGDKVSYQPYRDLEPGLYAALSAAFTKVAKVNGAADPKVAAEGLKYIVRPLIATTSDSPSLLTWPPTVFTVELICSVLDLTGRTVLVVRAAGEGRAEFDEFKMDHSLSAKRAAEVALERLIRAFADSAISLN